MQHDLFQLIDVIMFAKENFSDNMNQKFAFKRTNGVDAFGVGYRADVVKLDFIQIHATVRDGFNDVRVFVTVDAKAGNFFIPKLLQDFKDGIR